MFSSSNSATDIAKLYTINRNLNRLISTYYSFACFTLLQLRMGKKEEIETEQAI